MNADRIALQEMRGRPSEDGHLNALPARDPWAGSQDMNGGQGGTEYSVWV